MSINPRDLSRPHVWEPPSADGSGRTLLLLHGSGADEHDLLGLGRALDPTANLLSPRGLVKVGGANRYFEMFSPGVYDEPAVVKNSAELADFVWAASGEYGFDASDVYVVGFSNGANAAHSMLLLQPDSLAGVVVFGTNKVFAKTPFAKQAPDLTGKRVWVANGAADQYSPEERVKGLMNELGALGADVKYMLHAGGHHISPEHVRIIGEQLRAG
jgi:phospholipase/carboxylesterase